VLSPAVRRLVEEHALDASTIAGTGKGGRLLKEDVVRAIGLEGAAPARAATSAPPVAPAPPPAASGRAATPAPAPGPPAPPPAARAPIAPAPPAIAGGEEADRIVPMSTIRQRIAERLVRAQHTAAILTTFNEFDMSAVMELRARYREDFEKRHGVRLGFMSFFSRACILALQEFPELNAEIRGTDIVYHPRVHLGIAVQTERGLVVPVVRAADRLAFAAIEREVARLAERARENRLTLDELSGGTFTITNGGVFGSLFSTPILNPPQSGILGMHKIEKRPVVVNDQIAIRPMMYVALSYDHRIVDGEQAVTFLVRVREMIEDPERMLLDV
jgi:2-oxoglutarate dehydrogenase E2 component (dihydrolipoamide succinyltransferase)